MAWTARCLNPKCGTPLPGKPLMLNSVELKDVHEPRAGDIGICAGCGHIMIYLGIGNAVRDPSEEEITVIKQNREVMEIRRALLARLVKTYK